MKKNQIALRPSYWASVSGGKDSLFMLNYILNHLDKYPLDGVVHYELEIDFPFVKRVIDDMQRRCESVGIRFYRFRPRKTWIELYEKYGYPSRTARWCNNIYKLDCEKQLDKLLKASGAYVVNYIGFCLDEAKRFRFDLEDRGKKVTEIYPLAEAGIIEEDIWLWAREQPIFQDYYKYNKRCGCMGCPNSSIKTIAYMMQYFSGEWEAIKELARKTEQEYNTYIFCGRKVDELEEYVKQKYLPLKELPVPNYQYSFFGGIYNE